MIRPLTDSDLSKLTRSLPCGDGTFQRKFAVEYLLIPDYEYKKHKHDQGPYCEEIVYECLLTWKQNLKEKGETATNQKLIDILDEVSKNEGLVKKEDFRFLGEAPDLDFHDKFKRFKRWFKKFLQTQLLPIFAVVSFFVLSYFDLAPLDVSICFMLTCLLVKLFNDGEILMVTILTKDRENKCQQEQNEFQQEQNEFQQEQNEFQQEETEFQQEQNEFQHEETERAVKLPNKFRFEVSKTPLSCDIEEKFDQFMKLNKISKEKADKSSGLAKDLSDATSSIPNIKFRCVMKKSENDILLEIYDPNDFLRMFDIRDFIYHQEIYNILEAAFIGGGILRLSSPFVIKNSEKVTITVKFYMSPWDSKLESMIFWASRHFVSHTSRIKFRNDGGEFEVKVDGFTTAEYGNIHNELRNTNAKIDDFKVCPITLMSLKLMAFYEEQPRYEFLESLCLEALSRDDNPLEMQQIIRDELTSKESIPDQNSGKKKNAEMAYKTNFHSSRMSIPVTPVHELSSPATHSHELLSSPARYELLLPVRKLSRSRAAQFPMCYSAVNYSVPRPMSMGPGYLGLN